MCPPPSPFRSFTRQSGVHVSPTATVNGLIVDTSSGWELWKWKELLDPVVAAAAAAAAAPK